MTRTRTALVIGGGIAGPADRHGPREGRHRADRLRGAPDRRRRRRRRSSPSAPTASTRCACSTRPSRRSPRASRRRGSRCAAPPASGSGDSRIGVGAARRHDQPDAEARRPLPRAARRRRSPAASGSSTASGWSRREETGGGVRGDVRRRQRGDRRRADRLRRHPLDRAADHRPGARRRRATPGCSPPAASRAACAVDAEPGGYEMIFGRRAFFGYGVAPDGEVWWFANVPRRPEPARGELRAVGGDGGAAGC